MLIISCDPGLTGAVALIDSNAGLLDCFDIPACSNGLETGGMKRWIDAEELASMLRDLSARFGFVAESVHAVIERPVAMPTLPVTTIAAQFDTFGVLRACMGRHATVKCVAPNIWKKLYAFGKDKAAARECCLKLYPTAPVQRAKDHNRAEAILIGHWLLKELA